MGNSLNLNLNNQTIEYLTTIEYLEKVNYQCPDKLTLVLYEISICNDPRRHMYWQIKEFFIPEFNISINNVNTGTHKYNIIINSSSRYNNTYDDDCKPSKQLKTICLTKESNSNELEELFDLIITYTKSQNMENTIKKLFEQVDD
jgi:hypothetical protein